MTYIKSRIATYLSEVPNSVKLSEFPLTKMDLNALEGVQYGIGVFKGDTLPDIALISKRFETVNFFRGCKWGCLHCLKNAKAPKPGKESVLFEDLKKLASGFRILSERLGFNVLNGNHYISIVDDSNPFDLPINGLTRKYDAVDGIEVLFKNLKIPALVVTSGIDTTNKKSESFSSKVAKKLNKTVTKNPDMVKKGEIAINPCLRVNDYTGRMAKTLAIFLDLFKIEKAKIIYRHTAGSYPEYDFNAAKKLYEEIFKKLQNITGYSLEGISELNPKYVTAFDRSHLIEPSGRGRRFFDYERNGALQKDLNQDYMNWENLSETEKKDFLLDNSLKGIDIDGSVYATIRSCARSESTPIELIVPTGIKLNYVNKEKPNPLFSDIVLD